MTKLIEKAFKAASKQPVEDQNALAKRVIEESEAEKKWEHILAGTENALDRLADEALEAHKKGKRKSLDVDRL